MTKTLLSIFILIIVQNSYGQFFSIDDLINLHKQNNDFFDTYVVEKGYHMSLSNTKRISYTYKTDLPIENSIAILYQKNQKDTNLVERSIWWTFKSDSNYIRIKKELTSKGFSLFNNFSEEDGNGHHFIYANSNIKYNIEIVVKKPYILKVPVYHLILSKD